MTGEKTCPQPTKHGAHLRANLRSSTFVCPFRSATSWLPYLFSCVFCHKLPV